MELVTFIITATAVTVTLARAEILEMPKGWIIDRLPVRLEKPIGSLMYCSQCMGFWFGIIISMFITPKLSGTPGIDNILLGFVSSYFSSLGDKIIYGYKETDDSEI